MDMANIDDTRHITTDQYEDIKCQLDDLVNASKTDVNREEIIENTLHTILDILCLELPA